MFRRLLKSAQLAVMICVPAAACRNVDVFMPVPDFSGATEELVCDTAAITCTDQCRLHVVSFYQQPDDRPPLGDGSSWDTPLHDLQQAINTAHCMVKSCSGIDSCEVWHSGQYFVAKGSRDDTLHLRPGVKVYGGFDGTESSPDERALLDDLIEDFQEDEDSFPQYPMWNNTSLQFQGNLSLIYGGSVYGIETKSRDPFPAVYHAVTGDDDTLLDGFVITRAVTAEAADDVEAKDSWRDVICARQRGAGLTLSNGNMKVSNCVFVRNGANPGDPEELSPYTPGCTVGTNGGAAAVWGPSSLTIERCLFQENQASFGGAVSVHIGGEVTVSDSVFYRNNADEAGGAIFRGIGEVTIANSKFIENNSENTGGAITSEPPLLTSYPEDQYYSYREYPRDTYVENSLFWANSAQVGGAILHASGQLEILSSTIFENHSILTGAVAIDPCSYVLESMDTNPYDVESVQITNSILWGNRNKDIINMNISGLPYNMRSYFEVIDEAAPPPDCESKTLVSASIIEDGYGGGITDDPLLVVPEGGTLTSVMDIPVPAPRLGSPCIDAADGNEVPETDINGNPRVDVPDVENTGVGTPDFADIGAVEFQQVAGTE